MSKVDNLINKLCPNGVAKQKIKDICNVSIGEFVHKNKQRDDAPYPVYNGGISHTGYYDEYNNDGEMILISARGANAGFVNKISGKYWAGNSCYTLDVKDRKNNNWVFMYYSIKNNEQKLLGEQQKGSIPAISKKQIEEFEIAVPPLEVQCEIVRILDSFTLLSEELLNEMKARKKQYEYYENALLHNEYPMIKLEEVCNITSGGTPSKTKQEYWNNGTIKWLGSTVCKNKKFVDEVTGYITELGLQKSSAKLMKERTTLIAMVGATIGKVSFLNFEATTNQNVACLFPRDEEKLNPDYLYYACKNLYSKFMEFANGKFAMASLGFIKELEIPIPSIEEQIRIVNLLERFDKICNDISEGLPAEIEARQKQYEYYRDKLLTFKELKINE